MKIEVKDIPKKALVLLEKSKQYAVFLFVIFVLLLFGFLVFRINQLNQAAPSEDTIQEKLQTVNRPRVDQSVIDKIQQLRGQNIQVEALFQQARDNPFHE